MKHLQFSAALFFSFFLAMGCGGSGDPSLTSITVNPQTGIASPNGHVGFTAVGHMSNGSTVNLTAANGLTWKISTTDATIGSTGTATCLTAGSATVTAAAPQNLQTTANNGVSNTSQMVSGTAQLMCQVDGYSE